MAEETRYAGFWLRALAFVVDGILINVPLAFAARAIGGWAATLTAWVAPIAIDVGFWQWKKATPGKLLLGLSVVRAEDFSRLGVVRGVIRSASYYVSTLPVFMGFVWVAFDKKKRGFHDYIAKSVVIREKEVDVARIAAALGVIFVALAFAAYFWTANFTTHNVATSAKAGVASEGAAFARNRTQNECILETLRRNQSCHTLLCEPEARKFLHDCASVAMPSPGICETIPKQEDTLAAGRWVATECLQLGRANDICAHLMNVFFDVCKVKR